MDIKNIRVYDLENHPHGVNLKKLSNYQFGIGENFSVCIYSDQITIWLGDLKRNVEKLYKSKPKICNCCKQEIKEEGE